jgi:hypothetical protein
MPSAFAPRIRATTHGNPARFGLAALLAALVLAPQGAQSQRRVPTADPEHPRIKYADSLESVNDRCIVRMNPLNPKMRPVYVNRLPIGFC